MSLSNSMLIIENPKWVKITYSKHTISIPVWFESRNRLRITVQPDKSIIVKAPLNNSLDEVQTKLQKRASWITRQLEYFDQYHPILPPRRYVSGETFYFLGRQYRLKVITGLENNVKLVGKYFLLYTLQPDNLEQKKQLLEGWYSSHAKVYLQYRISFYIDRVTKIGAKTPLIKFRKMKKRWGSCTPSGVITFNTELIKAPIHCIDYVVLHELCHLVHAGHNAKFYQLLDTLMPDWKKRKERLEKVILE